MKQTSVICILLTITIILFVLIINNQYGRYEISSDGSLVLDTKTSELWFRTPYFNKSFGTNETPRDKLEQWAIDAGLNELSLYGKLNKEGATSLWNEQKNNGYWLRNAVPSEKRDFYEFEKKVINKKETVFGMDDEIMTP